jgi:hypothetical protein
MHNLLSVFTPYLAIFISVFFTFQLSVVSQPELASWYINTDGSTGQFWNNGQLTDNGILCNVQQVQYSDDNVYINATGIPSYATAPYNDGNPSQASDTDYLFRIPRDPVLGPSGGTPTGLGQIGVLVNGVPVYNAFDAFSFNNLDIWHQNGGFFELAGFDCAKGHPAMGRYHHHLLPSPFSNSQDIVNAVCSDYPSEGLMTIDPSVHSPLIGFAFDGYPIYGPYAYDNVDGTGGIVRMESSYSERDITVRHTLADGTVLSPNEYGPDVGELVTPAIPPGADPVEAVIGAYIEDFEFVEGAGHLDENNGRICVTPEYPNGIYAYFGTVDESWNGQFPYFIFSYYGVVATDNLQNGGPVVINEEVETYDGSSRISHLDNNDWTLFPNPVSDQVNIRGQSIPQELRLLDASGRIVSQWNAATGYTWYLGKLSPGIYFAAASDGTKIPLLIVE